MSKRNDLTEKMIYLKNWSSLNEALKVADEKCCYRLLELERELFKRKTFLRRIHSRLNKVRADREREQLEE